MNLAQIALKSPAVIEQVSGENALRCRLLDMGLIPGTRVSVQKAAPMGDPIELLVRGYRLTLRKADAAHITVRMQDKEAAL
jgi:ferrous iron transport protein A